MQRITQTVQECVPLGRWDVRVHVDVMACGITLEQILQDYVWGMDRFDAWTCGGLGA